MRTHLSRLTAILTTMGVLAALPAAYGAQPFCSVYLESIGEFQRQLQNATLVFDAPELGMYPMMLTMMVPGAAQVKTDAPLALHVYDTGNGQAAVIMELTPATTPDMFLKALTAASGKPLPPPVNGRYTFDGGVAHVQGGKLLLARQATELDACVGVNAPKRPAMPAIKGLVRVSMTPVAAVPLLKAQQARLAVGMPAAQNNDVAKAREMMDQVFNLYSRALSQIQSVEIGLELAPDGILIHRRLAAVPGTTTAGILASMEPAGPEYQSFISRQSLLSVASGRYRIPDLLKQEITAIYVSMMKHSPMLGAVSDADLTAWISPSIQLLGAPTAFAVGMSEQTRMRMQGAVGMANAAGYLEQVVDMMAVPAYRAFITGNGMRMADPIKRQYRDATIYSWVFSVDEDELRKTVSSLYPELPMDEKTFAQVKTAVQLFGDSFEYAASPKGLAFGMGSPVMAEQAVDRLDGQDGDQAEARRIATGVAAGARPVSIGRLALADAVRMMIQMKRGDKPVMAESPGEGVVFADWLVNGDIHGTLLVPASEVKSIRAMMREMQPVMTP